MRKTLYVILTAGLVTLASAPAFALPVLRINIGVPKVVVARTYPAIAPVPRPIAIRHKVFRPHPYQQQVAYQPYCQEQDSRIGQPEHPIHPEHPDHPEHPAQPSLQNAEHPQFQGWNPSFSRREKLYRR